MLKIKSKAILAFTGLMVAAFVLLGAYSASADLVTLPAAGVSKASSKENVKNLQTFLNWNLGSAITPLVVDGLYGAKTTAAIRMFQTNNGLVSDGVFGKLSVAKAMALQANMSGGTYPAGCASASGYSSTTGMPCAGGSYPAGCTSAMGFSSTTGAPCNGPVGTLPAGCASASGFSVTTGQACTATTVSTGTNGYLADLAADSTNRVTTVYESEQDKVIAGFRATARLSSQTVNRVRVTMVNTNTSVSTNLSKYISSASLWYGSTKIATMAVAQADRATSSDTYTFNFSGISAMIAQDQVGRFYVSVNANGSLDSTDAAGATWTTTFVAGGVQAVSPDGSVDTYPSADIAQTGTMFGKFSSSGVKSELSLSTSNPAATVIPVSATTTTTGVEVLKFKIKATNSNLTLRKIPVQITISSTTAGDDLEDVINTVKLMQGANVVDTVDGSSGYQFTAGSESTSTSGTACTTGGASADDFCTFYFSNLSAPYNAIASGSTVEYSIVLDFKSQANYTTGTTVTTSFVNADVLSSDDYSVQDTNGDQLTDASATVRIGSAVGQVMTLRVNGLQVAMGPATITKTTRGGNTAYSADVVRATYSIPVTLQAFGQTLYVGQGALYAAAATGTTTTAKTISFGIEKASAPTTTVNSGALDTNVSVAASLPTFSCTGAVEGAYDAYRIDAGGAAVNCTLTVTLSNTGAGATTATESYRVQLNDARFFTSNDLTTGAANQSLLPTSSYQTDYATGVSTSA